LAAWSWWPDSEKMVAEFAIEDAELLDEDTEEVED